MKPYFVYENGELDLTFRSSVAFRFRRTTIAKLIYWMMDDLRVLQFSKN
jgi:hypothetical protein